MSLQAVDAAAWRVTLPLLSGPMHHRSRSRSFAFPQLCPAARAPRSLGNLPPQLCASEDAARSGSPPTPLRPTAPAAAAHQNRPVVDVETASSTLAAYDEGHRRTAAQPERGPRRRAQRERVGGRAAGRAAPDVDPRAARRRRAGRRADHAGLLRRRRGGRRGGAQGVGDRARAAQGHAARDGPRRRAARHDDLGAVYIKYSSQSLSLGDPPGTAILSGYGGDFRGVYFNPQLPDGAFRQYAVLPLGLFELAADVAAPAAAAPPPPPRRGRRPHDRRRRGVARDAALAIDELGGSLVVEAVVPALGVVRLAHSGPPKLRKAIEFALKSDVEGVLSVEIRDAATDVAAGADAAAAVAPPRASRRAPLPTARAARGRHHRRRAAARAGLGAAGAPPLAVDAATLEAIRAAEYQPIFNGQPADEALRHMGRSREWATAFEATFTDALRDAGLLVRRRRPREGGVRLLRAPLARPRRGGPRPRQGDYEPARVGRQPPHSDAPERRAPTRRGRCPTPTCRCRRCSA